MSLDLHIHSTHSDGTLTPAELVSYASRKGLKGISITDHDTVEGVGEAQKAGDRLGLEVISGLELSVKHDGFQVHLLGYLFDIKNDGLRSCLNDIQRDRVTRNVKILEKLNRLGITLNMSEVEKISGPGQLGRPHFAKVLVRKKYVQTMDEAFSTYLGLGGSGYVPRTVLQLVDGIQLIKDAGGLAVLAHPYGLTRQEKGIDCIVAEMTALGLDGIEVYYPTHSKNFRKDLLQIARDHVLLVTGGSDYHGDIRPGTSLAGGKNVSVPGDILQKMKDRLAGLGM